MNVKKIAAVAGAGALFLAAAVPALAWFSNDELLVVNKGTSVYNDVFTKAYGGDINVGGKYVLGGTYKTGSTAALATLDNVVNFTNVASCNCYDDVTVINKYTKLDNDVFTKAYGGDIDVHGKYVGTFFGGGPTATTGSTEVGSFVSNAINTVLVGSVGSLD